MPARKISLNSCEESHEDVGSSEIDADEDAAFLRMFTPTKYPRTGSPWSSSNKRQRSPKVTNLIDFQKCNVSGDTSTCASPCFTSLERFRRDLAATGEAPDRGDVGQQQMEDVYELWQILMADHTERIAQQSVADEESAAMRHAVLELQWQLETP